MAEPESSSDTPSGANPDDRSRPLEGGSSRAGDESVDESREESGEPEASAEDATPEANEAAADLGAGVASPEEPQASSAPDDGSCTGGRGDGRPDAASTAGAGETSATSSGAPDGPASTDEGAAEGDADPKGSLPQRGDASSEPLDAKARRRAEVESFLGPAVRTPVGIPDGYLPNERSVHPLFHVEVNALQYAGPLDLLIYLIRKHDLDIFDIPITFILERYLEVLRTLEALEIDIAAEFLVLAAELAHIKSKMLLPADKGVAVEDPPEEEEQKDPRAELVRRLLEYQKYRDAAAQLQDRDQLGRDVFPRVPPALERVDDLDPGLKQVSVFRLVELMARLLREAPVHHEISFETFGISERIQYVSAFGEVRGGRFTLMELVQGISTRTELVVTFIALLEMAKMGLVRILVEAFHETSQLPAEGDSARSSAGARASPWSSGDGDSEGDPEELSAPSSEVETKAEADAGPARADETEAQAAQREAAALEALAEEAAAEGGALGDTAVDLPADVEARRAAGRAERLEPLPEVWVELTEKRFQGELIDDYR